MKLKEGINDSITVDENFNTPFAVIDRTTRQTLTKDIEDLHNAMNQMNLT